MALGKFDNPSYASLLSVGVGYGLILLAMFVALFLLPFLVFVLL